MIQPTLVEMIRLTADALEAEGVTYALTGSVASSIHGEPYTSEDADFVTRMTPAQAQGIARHFQDGYYADAAMLGNAAIHYGSANIYELKRGVKIDITVLPNTEFNQEIFRRRMLFHPPQWDHGFYVVSPEDLILMKLAWRRDTRSSKQWENALGVARMHGARLDWKHLRHWAQQIDVKDDLEQLFKEANI